MGITIKEAQLIEQVTGKEKIPVSDGSGLPKAVTTQQIKEFVGSGDSNVQSDWNEENPTSDAYIKNKPSIPNEVTEETVGDWGFTKNKGNYSKPITGIPKSDLDESVKKSLEKADTALQEHQDISGKLDKTEAASTYLSKTEASSTYLGKTAKAADSLKADSATKATQDGNGNNIVNTYATKNELNGKGTYSKPSTGIPKSDLASAVQTSLGKADTALQSEQYKGTVTSIKINGTTKTPDTNGMVDLGTIEGGGVTEEYVNNAIASAITTTLNTAV